MSNLWLQIWSNAGSLGWQELLGKAGVLYTERMKRDLTLPERALVQALIANGDDSDFNTNAD